LKGIESVKQAAICGLQSCRRVLRLCRRRRHQHGAADVVVTDGFSGNIAVKTAEGTAKMVSFSEKRAVAVFSAGWAPSSVAVPCAR
jgi:glycerol-3-phosphate acyltransferase PlsX